MPRRLLLLLAALTALTLVSAASALAAGGAQTRVRALTEPAAISIGSSTLQSACSHPGSAAGSAELAAGFCVATEDEPSLVYRSGSATPKNLTPRPGVDTTGLSTFDNPGAFPSGTKLQIIDTSRLDDLEAFPDDEPPGHVSLAPSDPSLIEGWAATRGGEEIHAFTQEIIDAIIGTTKAP